MGTIVTRRRKSGGNAYLARIILKRGGEIIHEESKTHETHKAASSWMKRRETELSKPGEIERLKRRDVPLCEAIDRYRDTSKKKIGRTISNILDLLKADDIADMASGDIKSQDIVDLARRLGRTRKPATVHLYISTLKSVFEVAQPAWGIPLDRRQMEDAIAVATRLGLVGPSRRRDRRPTLEELDALMSLYSKRRGAPMTKLIAFAIFSTRRREEISRITWEDLDEAHSRVLVRNMKNPDGSAGNDVWCELTPEAMAIIRTMPRTGKRIFPYHVQAITNSWTRACKKLKIKNLRFHDLRHEGISRLFEMGKNIPQAASVSGHQSWTNLKRYTHIMQTGDKYAGWPWLDRIIQPQQQRHKPQNVPCSVSI